MTPSEILDLTRGHLIEIGSGSRWKVHEDLMEIARDYSKAGGTGDSWFEGLSEPIVEHSCLFTSELRDIWASAHGEKLVGATLFAYADKDLESIPRPEPKPRLWAKAEDLTKSAVERLYKYKAKDFSDKVPTGLRALDEFLEGGLHRRGCSILAAPSGGGKTTIIFQWASDCLRQGGSALVCSPEMDEEVLLVRELCRRAQTSKQKFARYDDAERRIVSQVGSFKGQELYLTTQRKLNNADLARIADEVDGAAEGLDLIVLDYAQFFGDVGDERRWAALANFIEWATIELAQKHNAAVLVTSQVNIAADGSFNLRESRSIHDKSEADIHFKSPKDRKPDADGVVPAEFWLAKNRHGPSLCSIAVSWYPGQYRISEGEEL